MKTLWNDVLKFICSNIEVPLHKIFYIQRIHMIRVTLHSKPLLNLLISIPDLLWILTLLKIAIQIIQIL